MTSNKQPALSIKNLTKVYDDSFKALKGIDLDVAQGDFFALLGPNGAGKSTTIGIICSLVRKTSGTVTIFGHDVDEDFSTAKQFVGVVPQEFNFNQFEKPIDILVAQAGYFGIKADVALQRAEKYLKQLGLWDRRSDLSRNLSGGMKRRLMIARALIHEPKLLVLDEPTAGVDIELRRSMWEFLQEINKQGTTIILTTHYLEEAESLCRNIAIIDHGAIVQNTSMKALLKELNRETFVLDIREELQVCPVVADYPITLVENHSIEVEVLKSQSINRLFASLSEQDIHVISMRNKTNRLEELFFDMVEKNLIDGDGRRTMNSHQKWVAFDTILRREIRRFMRIWPQTLLPPVITIVLYFVIFGQLIGSRIGTMSGLPYIQFVAPGLIMMSVITNSYSNVVSSFFGSKFQRNIEELLVSPTPNWIILLGYVAGGMCRGLGVGSIVTLLSLYFADFSIHSLPVTIGIVLMTSLMFSLAGLINAIFAANFDDISIIPTFVLTPLTYLGGVFYSIELLSDFWRNLSMINPVLYMVNAFRYGLAGITDINIVWSFSMVGLFSLVLFFSALRLLEKGSRLRS